jgi:hypothetical protein
MAQQTAMQKLIEWATSQKDNEQQCIDWIVIKNKAEELLLIEKEQIMKTYRDGRICIRPLDVMIEEEYYNETFKK